ncbi:MAG: flagellar export protein FliJ [Eubacteriales bacterium]|nr:flagellar export protein FliJ [Eubacteriales bacterium]
MAKFIYRMQSILDIKYKLEEQAKQQYMAAQGRVREAEHELDLLQHRKEDYIEMYRVLLMERLDVLEIENCKNAIYIIDEYVVNQQKVVKRLESELENAAIAMNEAMKERKIYEKLKENQFEEFLKELNEEEMKEIDQLISYQYNDVEKEREE